MRFVVISIIFIIAIAIVTQSPITIFLLTVLLGTYIRLASRVGRTALFHMDGNFQKATQEYIKSMWNVQFWFAVAVAFSYALSYTVNNQPTHITVALWWMIGAVLLILLKKPLTIFNSWVMKDLVNLLHNEKVK